MRIRALLLSLTLAGLAVAQKPTINNKGIVNGASFDSTMPIAPGSLISIFGTALSSRTAQADTIPLSNSLGGVTVQFTNGGTTLTAPLLYVQPDSAGSPSQINAQLPWSLVPNGVTANVTVVVSHDGVSSDPTPVAVGPFSPGIFSSGVRAIATNADGTLCWPVGAVQGLTTRPAKPGDTIIIYATGLGNVDNPVADGAASLDKLRNTLTVPVVLVSGLSAQVSFSGLSPQFVGVNQLNVVIPNVAANDNAPLQLQVGGFTSSDGITIAISH